MTQTVLLGDICKKISSGGTPRTSEPSFWGGGYPWLSSGETGQRYIYRTEKTITKKGIDHSSTRLARSGSTVIASAGQGKTRGQASYLELDTYINQSVVEVCPDSSKVDSKYLFFYLSSLYDRFRDLSDSSSVRGSLTTKILAGIKIQLPDLEMQRKIAGILGSIDEKIELNRRMNETLEQMGQALFRHYFIDNPEAERWEAVKIGELVNMKGGGTPSTKNPDFWNGDIAWTSPRDLTGKNDAHILATDKTITEDGLAKISSGLLPEGALLLSSRAPIGYVAIAGSPMAINQGYIAFLPGAYLSNHFMYFWLKCSMGRIKNAANGSTFMEISKSAFHNITTMKPSDKSLQDFDIEVASLFDAMRNNQEQIQTLTTLRDTLLPRLISGKVKV